MTEALMLSTTRISTFAGARPLTAATGFFFRRGAGLYLVTSRHVLHDPPGEHLPDRIEIVLHADARNLTRTVAVAIPLYRHGQAVWRQGADSGGEVDVAVIELEPAALQGTVLHAFGPEHLQATLDAVPIGTPLLLLGFPLGFYDTLHHLPVARHAVVASAFGVRFQGQGYFLTDARMHRGSSGAPVVARSARGGALPWTLLGVHSARLDMAGRDQLQDDVLGLNSAWYADILMTLTGPGPGTGEAA